MDPPAVHPALQPIRDLDTSSPDFSDQLNNILRGQEYEECVPELSVGDSTWLVNYLDKALDSLQDPSSSAFRKCLHELRSVSSNKEILPASYILSPDLLVVDPNPFASGTFSDVYKGTFDGSSVCVKRMRVYQNNQHSISKVFHQEAVMWRCMKHPKILPLRGVTIASAQFSFFSNLMPNGTIREYIAAHSDADILGLLSDVAEGLHYLHSCNVVHRAIRGSNILVDEAGCALIADFGHAIIVRDEGPAGNDAEELGSPTRLAAPEILSGGMFSKQADIFSFAMLMVEVFTGSVPFSDRPGATTIVDISNGRRPSRPQHPVVTARLWKLIQRCWDQEPRLRPDIAEVLQELRESPAPRSLPFRRSSTATR